MNIIYTLYKESLILDNLSIWYYFHDWVNYFLIQHSFQSSVVIEYALMLLFEKCILRN